MNNKRGFRLKVVIIAIVMLVGVIGNFAVLNEVQAATGLLTNPNFDNGTTGWTAYWGGTLGTSTADNYYRGSGVGGTAQAIKVTNRTNGYQGPFQDVKSILITNGQGNYTIAAWTRLASGSDDAYVEIITNDSTGDHYFYTPYVASNQDAYWRMISGVVNVTWTGTLNSARFCVIGTNSTADVYVDDCRMEKTTTDQNADLVSNPSFEDGSTSWTTNGGTLTTSSSYVHMGALGAKVSGRTNDCNGPKQIITSVLTSKGKGVYNAAAWMKTASGSGTSCIVFNTNDSAGDHWFYVYGTFSTAWEQTSGTVNLQWTGTLNSAYFYIQASSNTADLWVDDVSLGKPGTTVSYVDTTGVKPIIYKEGQPLFKNSVQITTDRPRGMFGWTWGEMQGQFTQAAADGFTDIGVVLRWDEFENTKDGWDWSCVDTPMAYCYSAGIKMELIIFDFDFCGQWNLASDYITEDYQKELTSGGAVVTRTDGSYIRYKLDRTDPKLLNRHKYMLTQLMNHIRSRCDTMGYGNLVIGVQIQNEPMPSSTSYWNNNDRSHSTYANNKWNAGGYSSTATFNRDVLWEYLNGLGKAVKDSNYPTYTRVNMYDWNLTKSLLAKNAACRSDGGTYIDFFGADYYNEDPNWFYNYAYNDAYFSEPSNLAMIMENGGKYIGSANLTFNALAGGAFYNVWDYVDSCAAGDFWNMGLYSRNDTNKTISAKSHVAGVANLNNMLKKDWYDLAVLKTQTDNLRFYNRTYTTSSTTSQTVNSKTITYSTTNGGGGICFRRDTNTMVFMSTTASQFRFPLGVTVASLQKGYYNSSNTWVNQGTVSYTTGGSYKYFSIGAGECVRLVY